MFEDGFHAVETTPPRRVVDVHGDIVLAAPQLVAHLCHPANPKKAAEAELTLKEFAAVVLRARGEGRGRDLVRDQVKAAAGRELHKPVVLDRRLRYLENRFAQSMRAGLWLNDAIVNAESSLRRILPQRARSIEKAVREASAGGVIADTQKDGHNPAPRRTLWLPYFPAAHLALEARLAMWDFVEKGGRLRYPKQFALLNFAFISDWVTDALTQAEKRAFLVGKADIAPGVDKLIYFRPARFLQV